MLIACYLLLLITPITIFMASTFSTLMHELRHVKELNSLSIPSYIVVFRRMEDEAEGLYEDNWRGCLQVRIKKLNTTIYFPSIFHRSFRLTGFFNTRYRNEKYVPVKKVKKIALAPITLKSLILPIILVTSSFVLFFPTVLTNNLFLMALSAELLLFSITLTLLNLSHILFGKASKKNKNDRYYYKNPSDWYEKK